MPYKEKGGVALPYMALPWRRRAARWESKPRPLFPARLARPRSPPERSAAVKWRPGGGRGGEGNKGDFGAKVGDFGQKGAAWRENERFPVGEGGFFGRGLEICGLNGAEGRKGGFGVKMGDFGQKLEGVGGGKGGVGGAEGVGGEMGVWGGKWGVWG